MGVIDIISILLGIAVGIIAGYFVRKNIYESKIGQANSEADRIIKQAEDDSKRIHKEKLLEAQEEIHKLRTESERENKERRSDLQKFERRVIQKEEILDKKLQNLEQKETSLGDKLKNVAKKEEEIEAIKTQQLEKLESISGITSDKAKEIILTNAERDVRREMSIMIKEIESQAKEEAEKKSREIIGYAIQKCAADHVAETTVTVVNLPNDEMKGRIIGREGRNIRTLETLTGIDLIIEPVEWGTYLEKSAIGQHELILGGWFPGTNDSDIVLYPLYHTDARGAAGNRSFYSNPEYDKLAEEGRLETDMEKRAEIYRQAQAILEEDLPLIPILRKNELVGMRKNITNFIFRPNGHHILTKIKKVK